MSDTNYIAMLLEQERISEKLARANWGHEHSNEAAEWRALREAWGEANVLASYVATCRRNNTAEWMDGLIESINTFLEKSGDEDRVQLDRRGGSISIVKARQE